MLEYQKSSPTPSPSPKSASDIASLVWFRAYMLLLKEQRVTRCNSGAIPHVRDALSPEQKIQPEQIKKPPQQVAFSR